jgi:hypothetical protein
MLGACVLMMLNAWMQTKMNEVNRRTRAINEMNYKKSAGRSCEKIPTGTRRQREA